MAAPVTFYFVGLAGVPIGSLGYAEGLDFCRRRSVAL
jgi:hypothetical protein